MRVVILGASRFGEAIANKLISDNHEVVIIDRDRSRLEKLAETLDCGMIEGDGTMPTVLEEVFRNEDDAFVAVTNASEDNILASLVARSVGFGRVIPQIVSSELSKVCHQLELEDVINPHATVAESIAEALEDRVALDHDSVLQNQLCLQRVYVPEKFDGKTFGALDLPKDVRGIAIIRDEDEALLGDDEELATGDGLLLALDRERLDKIRSMFDDKEK